MEKMLLSLRAHSRLSLRESSNLQLFPNTQSALNRLSTAITSVATSLRILGLVSAYIKAEDDQVCCRVLGEGLGGEDATFAERKATMGGAPGVCELLSWR